MIDVRLHGLKPGRNFDNSPAYNKLIKSLPYEGSCALEFGHGAWYFLTPTDVIESPLCITGEGINRTTFHRGFKPTTVTDALIKSTSTVSLEKLGFKADNATKGGSAICITGGLANGSIFKHLNITCEGTGRWEEAVRFDSRTDKGIRNLFMLDVQLFAATKYLLRAINPVGLTMLGVHGYPAGIGTDLFRIEGAEKEDGESGRAGPIEINTCHIIRLELTNCDNVTTMGLSNVIQNNCRNVKTY